MTEFLTHTKRQAFQVCPRYFFHRHEQGLQLIAKKPGRRRGTIFGDALQAARDEAEKAVVTDINAGGVEFSVSFPDDPIKAAMESIDQSYSEMHPQSTEEAEEWEVERVKIRVMVGHYILKYGLEARREVEFELPLPTIRGVSRQFRRAGKIDGMEVRARRYARVIEDKFVGQIQKAMIERLPLDAQSSEYVDALLAKGWEAEVAYRHTRFPGINPEKAKSFKTKPDRPAEPLDQFELRLADDVNERPEFYFDEQILVFPKVHLDDYRMGRAGVARQIMDARLRAKEEGFMYGYPMSPTRCWEFGGCEFIPLCTKQQGAIDRYEVVPDNQELSEGSSSGGATSEYHHESA